MDQQEGEQKLETMETQGQQEDSDRLGRLTIQTLAFLGGLAGLIIAAFDLLASLIGLSSSHIPSGWSELGQAGGVVFLLLGLAGIGGAFLYTRNKKRAAWLLLGSGLLGFPVGYLAWIPFFGFLGWVLWIPPGVLLTIAGLLALITPERLRDLLGQDSETVDSADRKPLDQALFMGVIFVGIGLLTVILMFAGLLFFGAEDSLKGDAGRDQDDFNNANIAGSMGRWDKAVESYDDILSRNQSNVQAWKERAYALQKLGRYNEANESYEKARELNPENEILRE
ncbi:MAG: tetratricopeptide repeat protein [Methanothrix sp.]